MYPSPNNSRTTSSLSSSMPNEKYSHFPRPSRLSCCTCCCTILAVRIVSRYRSSSFARLYLTRSISTSQDVSLPLSSSSLPVPIPLIRDKMVAELAVREWTTLGIGMQAVDTAAVVVSLSLSSTKACRHREYEDQ